MAILGARRVNDQAPPRCDALARMFYRRMGYLRPEGHRFDNATHPQ